MLTSLCLNQSPGRIKSQRNWNREVHRSELAVNWSLKSLCVGQFHHFQQAVSAVHEDCWWNCRVLLSVCVSSVWIKSSPVESVCKCYTSHMSEPKTSSRDPPCNRNHPKDQYLSLGLIDNLLWGCTLTDRNQIVRFKLRPWRPTRENTANQNRRRRTFYINSSAFYKTSVRHFQPVWASWFWNNFAIISY